VLTGPRLRQVALVAGDCGRVAGELRRAFGWPAPFHDPGVGRFGLVNRARSSTGSQLPRKQDNTHG
jgi:hypothetical protein